MSKIHEIVRVQENGKIRYEHPEINKADLPKGAKVYSYLITPGHGYVRVPLAKLRKYGITRDITGYSYMGRIEAALEEDCDSHTFTDAVIDAGDRYFYTSRYVNQANVGMRAYHPHFAEHPVKEGSTVTLKNGGEYTVVNISRRNTTLESRNGYRAHVTTRTLMKELLPDRVNSFILAHPDKGALAGDDFEGNFFWTGDGQPRGPYVKTFQGQREIERFFKQDLKHAVLEGQVKVVEVAHDTWLSGDATIDVVVKAGVKSWPIDERHQHDEYEPVHFEIRGRTHTLVYGKQSRYKPLHHEVCLPGDYIQVPDVMLENLGRLRHNLMYSGGGAYLHSESKHEYVRYVQECGYAYHERVRWQADPLWYDQLEAA